MALVVSDMTVSCLCVVPAVGLGWNEVQPAIPAGSAGLTYGASLLGRFSCGDADTAHGRADTAHDRFDGDICQDLGLAGLTTGRSVCGGVPRKGVVAACAGWAFGIAAPPRVPLPLRNGRTGAALQGHRQSHGGARFR